MRSFKHEALLLTCTIVPSVQIHVCLKELEFVKDFQPHHDYLKKNCVCGVFSAFLKKILFDVTPLALRAPIAPPEAYLTAGAAMYQSKRDL